MTPLPFGSFSPSAKFTFPRSYVYDFVIYANGNNVFQTSDGFRIETPPVTYPEAFIVLLPQFIPWSSNFYTLDFVIAASYYIPLPGAPHVDLPFELAYTVPLGSKRPTLEYAYFGLKTDPRRFTLLAQPSNYWLPKPLP